MKAVQGRAALAAAITRRNAAAKAAEAAREAFEACAGPEVVSYAPGERIGEKYAELTAARYGAADRLASIVEKQKNYLERHEGDRVGLHRVFLHEFGKNAADTFADARRELDDAERAQADMAATMGRYDLLLVDAEQELASFNEAVDAEVQNILQAEAVRLAAKLAEEAQRILRKVGELMFVTRGVNFRHRDVGEGHPLYEARVVLRWLESIGAQTGIAEEIRAIATLRQEGAAPWIAAASRLAIDPNAPLPTDPKVAVAA